MLVYVNGLLKYPPSIKDGYADDNIVIPFKGRTIDYNKPIEVYRNLNKKGKCYSVRQGLLVVAHTTAICISDPEFIINNASKAKVLKSRRRNVQAFIKGMYTTSGMGTSASRNDLPVQVTYDPFKNMGFYYISCGREIEIKKAWFAIANEEGVKVAYIEK